jgi:hypothetical protein
MTELRTSIDLATQGDVHYGYGAERVFEQLNSHQPSGSRTVTQKITTPPSGARHNGAIPGTATITVNWKFEDVPN